MGNQELLLARRVLRRFGIRGAEIELIARNTPARAVWRVRTASGHFALKSLESLGRAHKVAAIGCYLHQQGVPVAEPLSKPGGDQVVIMGERGFVLLPWLPGANPRYETTGVIAGLAELLATFHEGSRGYVVSGGPIAQERFDWRWLYEKEMEKLKRCIREWDGSDDPFVQDLRRYLPWLRSRANWAFDRLPLAGLDAVILRARRDPLLGHHDFARHNILMDDFGALRVIDLDAVAPALPVWDLSYLISCMNHDLQSWSGERFRLALDGYRRVRPIASAEYELLLTDQVFPHQAVLLAAAFAWGNRRPSLARELQQCMAADRAKLADLGLGPREERK